jgi:ankyrin repeat protein
VTYQDSGLPTLVNPSQDTALTFAITLNDEASIERILAKSKTIISVANKAGHTPLLTACQLGLVSVVETLLTLGATIDKTDFDGNTPLHYAASYGQHKVSALLISKNADPTKKNLKGWTPFDYCYSLKIYDYLRACYDAHLTSDAFPSYETMPEPKVVKRSSVVSVRRAGMVTSY